MAQIELMIADQPFVSYDSDKKKPKEKKHTAEEMRRLSERWLASRGGTSYAKQEINLDDYLGSKVEPGMKL